MPMIISASDAILWTRDKIAHERHLELKRGCDRIRAQCAIDNIGRSVIRDDSATNRRRLNKRMADDKVIVSKLTAELATSLNHTQCAAAWVCNTRIDGPLQSYMRVVPLPVRTYI
jgi:hypothetical protein